MKSVLISIQPKWCELIARGKKTVEVRKTKPKLETPFKCYIYCTKGSPIFTQSAFCDDVSNGKVIGEFVCHNISEFESELWDDETHERITRVVHTEDWEGYPETESYYVAEDGEDNYLCRQSCLTWEDLRGYVGQDFNTFFGWHISDLVIYDKPRELSEFYAEGDCDCMNCKNCAWFDSGNGWNVEDDCNLAYKGIELHKSFKPIKRPPQSWCYVEGTE